MLFSGLRIDVNGYAFARLPGSGSVASSRHWPARMGIRAGRIVPISENAGGRVATTASAREWLS